jgi:hypothetical protein
MTASEKKVLGQIKKWLSGDDRQYMFWFVYNAKGQAVSWEGGWELSLNDHFRNQYTIHQGKVVKNWEFTIDQII